MLAAVRPHGQNAAGGRFVTPAVAVTLPKSRWRYSAFRLHPGANAYSMPPPAVQPTLRDEVALKLPIVPVKGPPGPVTNRSLKESFWFVIARPPVAKTRKRSIASPTRGRIVASQSVLTEPVPVTVTGNDGAGRTGPKPNELRSRNELISASSPSTKDPC